MSRPCLVIRVFTRDGAGGNHLGVVDDLSGLDGDTMQQIAAELGFSETIFIDTTTGDVPVVRIFTPAMELPFAGHPLVGAGWFLMRQQPGRIDRLRCGIGEVVIRADGELTWVDVPVSVDNARPDDADFATRVGLVNPVSTWKVSTPLDYRMVELERAEDVAEIAPDTTAFGDAHGLTAFARSGGRVRMRFFIPIAGVDEDPATGSAAVALATMFAARGEPAGELVIHQGEEIGHPSRIQLRWSGSVASIGGTVAEEEARNLAR